MTEFRRASSAVDELEALLVALAAFEAPPAGETLGEAAKSKYDGVEQKLGELQPVAEKMRTKCRARHELEVVKSRLRQHLPGAPDDCIKVAQDLVDEKDASAECLEPILAQAYELEGIATYGAKMVEKVEALLVRYDSLAERFAKIAAKLGGAVAAAGAEEAERQAIAEQEAAAKAAEEARKADEEARRPVAELLAASERRLQEQEETEAKDRLRKAEFEEQERRRKQEEEAARKKELELAAEKNAILRMAQEDEDRLMAEEGPDAACAQALTAMLVAPVGTYREVVEALQHMMASIAAEPADPRLRLIRVGNEGFQKTLGHRPGVDLFLRGAGFERYAWDEMPPEFVAMVGLLRLTGGPAAAPPPSGPFLIMREPDMLGEYDKWQAWHARIRNIADFLQDLARFAMQRSCHLGRSGMDVPADSLIQPTDILQRWEGR